MKTFIFKFFIFIFLLISPFFFLFGQPLEMILTGDPILEDIRFLALESGIPFLSFTPPLAPAEVKNFLNNIDENLLSEPAIEIYYKLLDLLYTNEEIQLFSAQYNLSAELEGRIRFNSNNTTFNNHYPLIPAVVSLPIQLYFYDKLQFYVEPALIKRPGKYGDERFEHNFPLEYNDLDEQVPLRVFVAAGGDWWNFNLGRDKIIWGTGHTGSLSFSNESAYYNFARASVFAKSFKYSMLINQMPIKARKKDNITFPQEIYNTENKNWDEVQDDIWNNTALTQTTQRYFYMHRIDFSIKNKVSIGFMEGVMVGNSSLELKYLNPLLLFHSLYAWREYETWPDDNENYEGHTVGSFMSAELNWNIIDSLAFYGQFVMNEWATPQELKDNPDQAPNAMGYMAGLQYAHSFINWGSIFFLEFIYTDPYLYILGSPFASIIQWKRYGGYDFIGFPRDTIATTFGVKLFNNKNLLLNSTIAWILTGEFDKNGVLWNWEKTDYSRQLTTPTGPQQDIVFTLGGTWKIMNNLWLNTNYTGIISFYNNYNDYDDNEIGGQLSIGIKYQFK